MRWTLALLTLVPCLGLLLPGSAAAQTAAQDATALADQKAVATFPLSLKYVEKATRANEALAVAAAKNPAFARSLHAQIDGSASLVDTEAKIKKEPAAMAVLSQVGLTPREFILTNAALAIASIQHQVGNPPAGSAAVSSKANLTFVDKHPKEVQALMKSMEKLQGDEGSSSP